MFPEAQPLRAVKCLRDDGLRTVATSSTSVRVDGSVVGAAWTEGSSTKAKAFETGGLVRMQGEHDGPASTRGGGARDGDRRVFKMFEHREVPEAR